MVGAEGRRCLGVYYLPKRIVYMGGSFAELLPCDMAVDSFGNETGFSGQAPELSFSMGSPEELSAYGNGLVPVLTVLGVSREEANTPGVGVLERQLGSDSSGLTRPLPGNLSLGMSLMCNSSRTVE